MPFDLEKRGEQGGPLSRTQNDENLAKLEAADALNIKVGDSRLLGLGAVINTHLAPMPAFSLKGNNGSDPGPVLDLDRATVKTMLGVVDTNDIRLSNARTPLGHVHPQTDITGLATSLAGKVGIGDSRLTDARTPLAHVHTVANITSLQAELDAKASATDPRFTDARTPLSHIQSIATVTGLQAALDAATAGGGIGSGDPRLTDPRPIADGNYGDFTVTGGVAAINPTIISGVLTTDPRLSDARIPLAHDQAVGTITGLQALLDAKVETGDSRLSDARVPLAHDQAISTVTGLQAALDLKIDTSDARLTDARTPTSHTQAISTVTGLQTALDAKVGTADARLTDNRVPLAHTHPQSEITNLVSDLAAKIGGSDIRLTDARTIKDANYTGFTVTAGAAAVNSKHITNTRMADMPAMTVKANLNAGLGAPQDTDATAFRTGFGLVATGDSRLSDARTPITHTHLISQISSLQGILDGFALQSNHAALQAQVNGLSTSIGGLATTTDPRFTDPRTIKDGDYNLFTVTGGAATLGAGKVSNASMASMAAGTVKARLFGTGSGAPVDVPDVQYTSGAFGRAVADATYKAQLGLDIMTGLNAAVAATIRPMFTTRGLLWAAAAFAGTGLLQSAGPGSTQVQEATGLDVSPSVAGVITPPAGTMVVTSQILRDTLKPRIVALASGTVDTDAALGLYIVFAEGADNIIWDENIWDNIPLDKEMDVWVKAGASARTHTFQNTLGNLLMPDDDASPFNSVNCWKHFIFKWLPSPTDATARTYRVVMYGGTFS